MLRLERRPVPSRLWALSSPVLAVLLTMIAGGVLFALLGKPPFVAIRTIFWDPLFSEFAFYYRSQLLIKSGPLILIAIGLSLGYRAGIWNIGAEGQYVMGAIFGGAVGLAFYPAGGWYIFPLMVIAGALGGILWAMIPALLRTRFGTNEILVSLMLVYVAQNILSAVSFGVLKNPQGFGFPGSRNLSDYPAAANSDLIAGSGLHWGGVAAILAVLLAWGLLSRHILGFQIQLSGQSPRAARFGGVNPNRLVIVCMGISGGLAGLAGLFEVAGPAGQLTPDFNVGYGFAAIIVAFLGRLHPLGIALAGLLLGLTEVGGGIAQQNLGLPSASINAFQGMLLFFLLATDVFTNFRIRLTRPETA